MLSDSSWGNDGYTRGHLVMHDNLTNRINWSSFISCHLDCDMGGGYHGITRNEHYEPRKFSLAPKLSKKDPDKRYYQKHEVRDWEFDDGVKLDLVHCVNNSSYEPDYSPAARMALAAEMLAFHDELDCTYQEIADAYGMTRAKVYSLVMSYQQTRRKAGHKI